MTISVLICTYGGPEWANLANERALPSVFAQRTDDDEVVTYHDPDGNISSVRNDASRRATGEWLCFLDADDEFAPGYLWAMRRALEQRKGDGPFLLTPAVQLIRKGIPGEPFFFERKGITLRDDNWLVIGTLITRDLFEDAGGFEDYPHGFEDFSLWSKCYRLGAEIVKVPDAVYRYFHNPRSKHKQGWRDRKWQVETHRRVAAELDAWEKVNT